MARENEPGDSPRFDQLVGSPVTQQAKTTVRRCFGLHSHSYAPHHSNLCEQIHSTGPAINASTPECASPYPTPPNDSQLSTPNTTRIGRKRNHSLRSRCDVANVSKFVCVQSLLRAVLTVSMQSSNDGLWAFGQRSCSRTACSYRSRATARCIPLLKAGLFAKPPVGRTLASSPAAVEYVYTWTRISPDGNPGSGDVSGVSRHTKCSALQCGVAPRCRRDPVPEVGTKRNVLRSDALHYKQVDDESRYAAARELTALSEELGLYSRTDSKKTSKTVPRNELPDRAYGRSSVRPARQARGSGAPPQNRRPRPRLRAFRQQYGPRIL